jgi:Clp amino terminal domain, pathogenicity island component
MATHGSFERFTERARYVLTLAQEEAQRFNHDYIGTEHFLLGLVRKGEGVAARVLVNLGGELQQVRTTVEFFIWRGYGQVSREIGLTPHAKKVIELAFDESRRLGHNYIGTEHLLLGLIREGEGIAVCVLESLEINLDKVRKEIIRVLGKSEAEPVVNQKPSPSQVKTYFPSPLPKFSSPPGVSHVGGESSSTTHGGKAGTYQQYMMMACEQNPSSRYEDELRAAGWVLFRRDESLDGAGLTSIWRCEDQEGDPWRAALMVTEIYANPRQFLAYVLAWWDPAKPV